MAAGGVTENKDIVNISAVGIHSKIIKTQNHTA